MILEAKTLRQPATFSGAGLHSGSITHVTLSPAPAHHGIVFVRTDLPGAPSVCSSDLDRNAAPFRTVLKKGAAEVHTVEHLLSALCGLGISDCRIEIDGVEVPGMDGSALPFAQAIQAAGTAVLNATVQPIVLKETLDVSEGIASIKALPHAGGTKISYTLNYPGHARAQGQYEIELSAKSYLQEIAPARTFAIKKDAEAMRAAGLGKGANTQNTVIIDGDRVIETTLRFENEPVRHKMLDLIGDLYVLGRPVHAHLVAVCSGHRLNAVLAERLRALGL